MAIVNIMTGEAILIDGGSYPKYFRPDLVIPQSDADLNALYPEATKGTEVIAKNIVSGGIVYEKDDDVANTWIRIPMALPNEAPEVDAGSDQVITTDSTTLSCTASDPDGSVVFYQWSKVSGPQEPTGIGFNDGEFTPLRTFTVTPSGSGDLVINEGDYLPGDLVILDGSFRSITINDLEGAAGNPIVFRNPVGGTTTIGNPAFNNTSGPSYGLQTVNSRHLVFAGTHWDDFVFAGSTVNTIPSGGDAPIKTIYRNISLDHFSEFIEICYFTAQDGGTSIVAKTDPLAGDSQTWFPNRTLGFIKLHDFIAKDSYNELLYIGHTATYWNTATGTPYNEQSPYDAPPVSSDYKQPIKIDGVKVWNFKALNAGKDAVQISACKNIEVYQGEIENWASVSGPDRANHCGGILIGGRSETSNVHDMIIHDAWGEHFQFYGTGPGHLFTNNLCYNVDASAVMSDGSMASIAGRVGTNNTEDNPAEVTMTGNTFARSGATGNMVRVNGYYNKSGGASGTDNMQCILNRNILMAPKNNAGVDNYDSYYVYTENPQDYDYNTIVSKGTGSDANVQYLTVAAANVDTNNYYLPNNGAVFQGFRKTAPDGPVEIQGPSVIVDPNEPETDVTGLIEGVYVFKITVVDNHGATGSDEVQVTVNL